MNSTIRKKIPFTSHKNCSKVILDVDTGCDDAQTIVTLVHLAKKYGKQILGITCTFGNAQIQDVILNTLITLKECDAKIKIYKGNNNSILGDHTSDYYFKQDSFNGCQKSYKIALTEQDYALIQQEPAFSFISRSIKQHKHQVALIMTGPVTNLAIAYLTDNILPQYLGSLTIMGGTTTGIGLNESYNVDFNFHGDAESIHIVLKNFQNVVLITAETAFYYNQNDSYFVQESTKKGRLIKNIFNGLKFLVCDPLTLFPVFLPESIIQVHKIYGQIMLQGKRTRGYLAIDWLSQIKKQQNLIIVATLNEQLINNEMLEAVKKL